MKRIGSRNVVTRTFLVLAVLASIMGSLLYVAQAASLTNLSVSISSSTPGDTSVDYTFSASGTNDLLTGIKFEFCAAASGSCALPATMSFDSLTLGAGDFSDWTIATSATDVTLTAGSTATIDSFDQVLSGLTNPGTGGDADPTVFFVRITTYIDGGTSTVLDGPSVVATAVIPVISVTGTQDAILQMTIVGLAVASGPIDGKTLSAAASATSLPFGNFVPLGITSPTPSSRAVAQSINVVTNGVTGYTATVLGGASVAMTRSGGSETIAYVSGTPTWTEGASGTAGFGVSADGGDAPGSFSGLTYFPISSSLTIASDSAPTLGADTTVLFRVQVQATQAAGDYTGNVNYTVLPNF